ncbi:hypothetical protein BZA77DRAFT_349200 [Pyronema omphalodes]|nr:hypothetical protein BZA77DRAFT_349200 [Pyronema omphalodes]
MPDSHILKEFSTPFLPILLTPASPTESNISTTSEPTDLIDPTKLIDLENLTTEDLRSLEDLRAEAGSPVKRFIKRMASEESLRSLHPFSLFPLSCCPLEIAPLLGILNNFDLLFDLTIEARQNVLNEILLSPPSQGIRLTQEAPEHISPADWKELVYRYECCLIDSSITLELHMQIAEMMGNSNSIIPFPKTPPGTKTPLETFSEKVRGQLATLRGGFKIQCPKCEKKKQPLWDPEAHKGMELVDEDGTVIGDIDENGELGLYVADDMDDVMIMELKKMMATKAYEEAEKNAVAAGCKPLPLPKPKPAPDVITKIWQAKADQTLKKANALHDQLQAYSKQKKKEQVRILTDILRPNTYGYNTETSLDQINANMNAAMSAANEILVREDAGSIILDMPAEMREGARKYLNKPEREMVKKAVDNLSGEVKGMIDDLKALGINKDHITLGQITKQLHDVHVKGLKPEALTPNVDPKLNNTKPNGPKPNVSKSEAVKPSAPKTNAPKSKAPNSEAPKPEAQKSEASKSEALNPDAHKPNAPKPNAPKPNAPKPNAYKPKARRPKKK